MDFDNIGNLLYMIFIVFFLIVSAITGKKKKEKDKNKEPGAPHKPAGKTLEEILRELTGEAPPRQEPPKQESPRPHSEIPTTVSSKPEAEPERKPVPPPVKKEYP